MGLLSCPCPEGEPSEGDRRLGESEESAGSRPVFEQNPQSFRPAESAQPVLHRPGEKPGIVQREEPKLVSLNLECD